VANTGRLKTGPTRGQLNPRAHGARISYAMITPTSNPSRVVPPAFNTDPRSREGLTLVSLIHFARLIFQRLTNEIPRNFPPLFGLAPSLIHFSRFVAQCRLARYARCHRDRIAQTPSTPLRPTPSAPFSPFKRTAPTHARHSAYNRPPKLFSPIVTFDSAGLARDHCEIVFTLDPWTLFFASCPPGIVPDPNGRATGKVTEPAGPRTPARPRCRRCRRSECPR
jgi:hypothetical protein